MVLSIYPLAPASIDCTRRLVQEVFYDASGINLAFLENPYPTVNNVSGYVGVQFLNLFADVALTQNIGRISFNVNYVQEVDGSTIISYDMEMTTLFLPTGSLSCYFVINLPIASGGFLQDTIQRTFPILSGTGSYLTSTGQISFQRISLENQIRRVGIYL
jgi:hypothetical protein